ncbi:hypothetical protein [Ornithinimicrobium panacihumi]|uniref:hypothetical protein n=1 Tax=Ornithinimicrobium panacihumi TaxID=2008449 RepID=UPI003F888BC0
MSEVRYAVSRVAAYLTLPSGMLGWMQGTQMEIEHGNRLLAQRPVWWKLLVSSWIVLVAAGFVMFSVLGWALGAVLARRKGMWLLTLGWGLAYAAAVIFFELTQDVTDLAILPFLIAWVGSVAHAIFMSRSVLRWRALALDKDSGWRLPTGIPQAQPAQPFMPTIPMPDGIPQHRGAVQDSAPPIPRPGQDERWS